MGGCLRFDDHRGIRPADLELAETQLAFRLAVRDALCPSGINFPTCHWRGEAGQTVTLHSFKTNAPIASAEAVYDDSGLVQPSLAEHLFPHGVLLNFRVELTKSKSGCK